MNIPIDEVAIFSFFFVLVRVSSIVAFFPFFGEDSIPIQVKVLFSLVLAAIFFPMIGQFNTTFIQSTMNSPIKMMFAVVMEISLGLAIGFIARLSFDAVLTAAHFIAAQMGLTVASFFDPSQHANGGNIQKLFYVIAMLLFLSFNGHYILLSVIEETFHKIPPGSLNFSGRFTEILIVGVRSMFIWAIKLSAPVMLVTMIMNAGMGLVARAVPQMNVMMVAFSVNILVGLVVLFVSLPFLREGFETITNQVGDALFSAVSVL